MHIIIICACRWEKPAGSAFRSSRAAASRIHRAPLISMGVLVCMMPLAVIERRVEDWDERLTASCEQPLHAPHYRGCGEHQRSVPRDLLSCFGMTAPLHLEQHLHGSACCQHAIISVIRKSSPVSAAADAIRIGLRLEQACAQVAVASDAQAAWWLSSAAFPPLDRHRISALGRRRSGEGFGSGRHPKRRR